MIIVESIKHTITHTKQKWFASGNGLAYRCQYFINIDCLVLHWRKQTRSSDLATEWHVPFWFLDTLCGFQFAIELLCSQSKASPAHHAKAPFRQSPEHQLGHQARGKCWLWRKSTSEDWNCSKLQKKITFFNHCCNQNMVRHDVLVLLCCYRPVL